MRRRRLLMFTLAGAVVVVAVLLAWPREREPEYKGRKLSEWALVYAKNFHGDPSAERQTAEVKDAISAIQHIGTNALPWMMEWIRYQPGPLKRKLYVLADKLPPAFGFVESDGATYRAELAQWCFRILGPQASPAIPELTGVLDDPKSGNLGYSAAGALADIGTDALPPLLAALSSQAAPIRIAAAGAMGQMRNLGTNSALVVAALVRCLGDPAVARVAAYSLSDLEPALVLPALGKALENPDPRVRCEAADAIFRIGKEGRAAIPALLRALDDPDHYVRMHATNALSWIAPEVLP